ncbi:MAG: hypothetical protein ACI9J3_002172 [Parvicellaceae bacterium]|jgi:hypothetical protein
MIKHSVKDSLLSISIAKKDFTYRIPVKKLGNVTDWKIGEKDAEGILIKGVSTWMLQLFTNKITDDKYIKQFKGLVEEHCPKSKIKWEETLMAVNIQNEYNWLNTAKKKLTEKKMISNLKKKYKLD